MNDIDFDLFEAVCGVQGEFSDCCMAEAPSTMYRVHPEGCLPCTRQAGHAGEHVAAHYDGYLLARWRDKPIHLVVRSTKA